MADLHASPPPRQDLPSRLDRSYTQNGSQKNPPDPRHRSPESQAPVEARGTKTLIGANACHAKIAWRVCVCDVEPVGTLFGFIVLCFIPPPQTGDWSMAAAEAVISPRGQCCLPSVILMPLLERF